MSSTHTKLRIVVLNNPGISVLEAISGRALAPLIAELSGKPGLERTLRNPVSEKTLEHVSARVAENSTRLLTKAGFSESDAGEWLSGNPKSLYAGLIYDLQTATTHYPRTLSLAREIDELSRIVYEKFILRDFKGARRALLDSELLATVYWQGDIKKMPPRDLAFSANTFEDLDPVLRHISAKCMFSLISLLDIEFVTQYFKGYGPSPLFRLLLPKVDPKAQDENTGNASPRRGMLWLPYRRMIALLSCMGQFVKNRKWPNAAQGVAEIAVQSNLPTTDFIKWRRGTKPLTYRNFQWIWDSLAVREKQIADCPSPIYLAATFWTTALVKVESKSSSIYLVEGEYLNWWNWHREKLVTNSYQSDTSPWPDCFSRI